MRKLIFILTVCVIAITSCAKKENSVVGKWKAVEMNVANMSEDEKKEMMSTMTVEFTPEGKFSNKMKDDLFEGTYSFNNKGDTMKTISTSGNSHKFKISWEGNILVMTDEDGVVKLKQ